MSAMAPVGFLSFLFLVFGGSSLPLGLPPAAEDPAISRVAPETCLAYIGWSGMAAPDAKATNQTEQLLAEPEVQKLLSAFDLAITTSFDNDLKRGMHDADKARDVYFLAKTLLTRPGAVYVAKVDAGPESVSGQGGAIFNLADKAPAVAKTLERFEKSLPPGSVEKTDIAGSSFHRIQAGRSPVVSWGIRDGYLIIGVGDGSVEGILKRLNEQPPAWLTAIQKQLPVGRVATVTYVNVKQLLAQLGPAAPPQVKPVLDAFGLGNVTSLASVTGLDDNAFISRKLVSIDGEPEGVFHLAAAKPLSAADLAPIPRDATLAFAGRLDAVATLDLFVTRLGKADPDARTSFLRDFDRMEKDLGIDVQEDFLKPLGDVWCVYNSPGEGGLLVTGLTGVVQVRDHDRLEATINKLVALHHDRVEVPADQEPRERYSRIRTPRIVKSSYAGQTIYHFDIPLRNAPPIAPAWCLTDKELIVAAYPQHVKGYLSRAKDRPSLAEAPEVAAALRDGGVVALGYCDTRKVAEYLYPLACIGGTLITDEIRQADLPFDASLMPSAGAILPHLQPSLTILRRTTDGVEAVGHAPIGGLGAANLFIMGGWFSFRSPTARMQVEERDEATEVPVPRAKPATPRDSPAAPPSKRD